MRISEVGYVSPAIRYDRQSDTVVFERRDSATGEVSYQVPSRSAVAARRRNPEPAAVSEPKSSGDTHEATAGTAAAGAALPAPVKSPAPAPTPAPEPAPMPRGALVSRFA